MSDPFSAQIVGHYLHVAANEAELALVRAAYSPVIKESYDCSAAIIGPDGLFWGQADAIPLQLGVLGEAQRAMLGAHPRPLADGDVLLSNDPVIGAPHLNDFVALAPVVADGAVLAYVATLAHYTDVGGKVPGSMPADATELFHEGFRLPPTPITAGGRVDDGLLAILLANTRTPDNLEADLRAQLAACALGVRRVQEAVERYGAEALRAHVDGFLDHSGRLALHQLARLRPGTYRSTRRLDDPGPDHDGPSAWVTATTTVSADGVTVDYSESCDQLRRPLNVVLSNGYAAALCALRSVLGPDVPFNGGVQRLLRVTCRAGSLMNPLHPAPVGARATVAALAYQCVLDCLGQAAPERAAASSSGGTTMPYVWAADTPPGAPSRILVDNSLTGGTGARAGAAGLDAVENSVTNAINLSTEMIEQDYPLVVERYEIRRGSGGPGRWPGGAGLRRAVRFRAPGTLSIRGAGIQYPPQGMAGGGSGSPARFTLERGGRVTELAGQASGVRTDTGDLFVAETPGGGGFGRTGTDEPTAEVGR